ncbi:MAG: AI-2E family transporter [Acidimicrobiales bacterium]
MIERLRRAGQVSWGVVGVAALVALLGVVVWYFRVVLPPLLLAGAIVFVLNPIVSFLQRRGLPRALGTGIAYVGFVAVVVTVGFLVAPLASRQFDDLSEEFPDIREQLEDTVDDFAERSERDQWIIQIPSVEEIEDELGSTSADLSDTLAAAGDIAAAFFHALIILVLAPIIAFYLLVDLPHLRRVSESLIPERAKPEVLVVASRLNRAIGGFFRGQLVVALIVGTMVSIGLAILGLPFWLVIGMIAGLFNMIPLIGPWIGGIPGVIIAITTMDFRAAIGVALIMLGAQQIDNHFITPYVMQRAVKLHPAMVMLALLAGGTLFGFFGLLLAVPATAALKILVGHVWRTHILGQPIDELVAAQAEADSRGGGIIADVGEGEAETDKEAPEVEEVEEAQEAEEEAIALEEEAVGSAAGPGSRTRVSEEPGGDGAPGTRVIRER